MVTSLLLQLPLVYNLDQTLRLSMALRVVAVLHNVGSRSSVLRSVGHAALLIGCCGLTEVPQGLKESSQLALARAMPSVGKTNMGAARHQILYFAMQLFARKQAAVDGAPEFLLQHVEFPAVDDHLVHFRPAGRIELAARQ